LAWLIGAARRFCADRKRGRTWPQLRELIGATALQLDESAIDVLNVASAP
jgi:hypothetical protein